MFNSLLVGLLFLLFFLCRIFTWGLVFGTLWGWVLFDFERNDGFVFPSPTYMTMVRDRGRMGGTSFARCQCLNWLMPFAYSHVKGGLLIHGICRIGLKWWVAFILFSRWWAKKEFAVSTLAPSHVEYSLLCQMPYIPRWPCWTLVGNGHSLGHHSYGALSRRRGSALCEVVDCPSFGCLRKDLWWRVDELSWPSLFFEQGRFFLVFIY